MVDHPRRVFLPLASLKAMSKKPKALEPAPPPAPGREPLRPAENELLVKYYILTVAYETKCELWDLGGDQNKYLRGP